jgi:iron complex outermembrane receptor protein
MKFHRGGNFLASMHVVGLTCMLAAHPARAEESADNSDRQSDILVMGAQSDALTTPSGTGSRLGLTPMQTPASIANLSSETIIARGDLDVQTALARMTGVTMAGNPGNGGTALSMRGFSGQGSVLQLVDGVRLFPVAGTITFPTDVWNVDRIEVLSGPASVLYGQGALGGAVNVVTKKPNSERTEAAFEAGYGSQDSWRLGGGVGGPITPTLSYRVDASYRQSDGWVDRGKSDSLALSGAVRFAPSETFSVTLRHDYGLQHPMRYFGTPLIDGKLLKANSRRNYNVADAEIRYLDNRSSMTIDWTLADDISLANTAYRLTAKRNWSNLESYAWNGGTGLVDRSGKTGIVHDQEQIGNQASVKISKPVGGMANDLVVGFDVNRIKLTYSHDFASDPQEDSVDPYVFDPGTYLVAQGIAPRYRTRTNEWSVFAEDRLELTDQLSLVAGVRHERDTVRRRNIVYSPTGTTEVSAFPNGQTRKVFNNTTWRVGGVYQPTPTLSIYGQYSTGVDPMGTLTTYTTSGSQFAFTNAKGDQVEAGVKTTFMGGRGNATLAAYRIVKKNLASQLVPNGPIQQVGQRSSKGIDASVSIQLTDSFGFDANASVLDARFDKFTAGDISYRGNTPANTPETSANLSLYWHPTAMPLRANANLRYVGRTYTNDSNTQRMPSYTVVDAGISYGLTAQIWVNWRITNLFDRHYAVTTYDPQQWLVGRPRSFDLSVSARF